MKISNLIKWPLSFFIFAQSAVSLASNVSWVSGKYSRTTSSSAASEYHLFKIGAIGPEDLRKSQAGRPSGAAAQRYSSVGTIDCFKPLGNGQYYVATGTATVVENSSTIITSGHIFYEESGVLRTDISNCFFSIRNNLGQVVGKPIAVKDMITPDNLTLANRKLGPNAGNDWAVLKLTTPVPNIVPFQVARDHTVNVGDKFHICSFSHDIQTPEEDAANLKVKACLKGQYRENGADTAAKAPMVLFHDISINGWSSGAPMFVGVSEILCERSMG